MSEKVHFVDILKPRNTQFGIFKFMTRSWVPKKSLVLEKCFTPQELKDFVANSVFMDSFLEAESVRQGVDKEQLRKEMLGYLDEMAFEKKIHVVRWMGIAFLKICFMMKIGVFVNEPVVLKLKASMGKNPVLFLPTHRSYADFCLMTYLCFHYDIDLPAVAAGMDFHSMAVVGQRMREMCAFYIRRTLVGAPLYAATLRHYVRTVVARHSAPVEFFLEGTRSRSNKSLMPRYGMLSMTLMPYFAREVADVTIVPVNISYDRLMELTLFAYEHLGVPKPKESTEGLLKSLQSLNDHFGNIYVNIGTPISLNEYFRREVPNTVETLKPVDLQQMTAEQLAAVQSLAGHVVALQQDCTTVTISSLISMVLMQSLMKNKSLHYDEVLKEVEWFATMFKGLGANVYEGDLKINLERILVVHRRMFTLDAGRHLRLVSSAVMDVTADVKNKMKGHTLKAETMVNAVPIIELQTYVNPVLHYLVPPAIIYLLVKSGVQSKEDFKKKYQLMRTMLSHEFFYVEKNEEATFNKALQYCIDNEVLARDGDAFIVGANEKLQFVLEWSILPALTTLMNCADVMAEMVRGMQRAVCARVQARGEARGAQPYALSLPAAAHALRGLHAAEALLRARFGKDVKYETVPYVMEKHRKLIHGIFPKIETDFGAGNSVIIGRSTSSRPVASRL
ncbi:dihydroxyacetone phosphate acyltransferase [Epargyreus clarus]|uniref:dihydroxyacetone phosphate acyltransferase n=1 Tax=Epargyreus clarus TaxID=520877 RepID=UPI003C2CE276